MSGDVGVEKIQLRGARFRKNATFLNFKWGAGDDLVIFSSPSKKDTLDVREGVIFVLTLMLL